MERVYDLVAFDLYGTLLDISGLSARIGALAPEPEALLAAWRKAQLALTWDLNARGEYLPFDRVTAQALAQVVPPLDEATRAQLCALWLSLPAFPDAKAALDSLASAGVRTAVLSNGTPAMIEAALQSAQLAPEVVLSADDVKAYKPDPRVYALLDALAPPGRTLFVSGNGWDVDGAHRTGRLVAHIDRGATGQRPAMRPDVRVPSLADLAAHVHPDWRLRGVRIVSGSELDPNTPQTPGMSRAAAINYASAGAQKLWAGTVAIHPDAKTGAHHHGDLETVIYVVRGRARMRWGAALEFVAEAGPGDFIFVPPFVPHQEINASPDKELECVVVRSAQDPVVVNLDIAAAESPQTVRWVDPTHR
jgi:2-haloalkanoic acid dehalogenase type II